MPNFKSFEALFNFDLKCKYRNIRPNNYAETTHKKITKKGIVNTNKKEIDKINKNNRVNK